MTRSSRRSNVVGLIAVASLCALALAPAAASVARATRPTVRTPAGVQHARAHAGVKADFNGDGFGDLAIGVPGENVDGVSNAGGVNVIYGSPTGLAKTDNQFFSQASPGVRGAAATNAHFGTSIAVGDFDHDGFTDLAVGVPGATVDGVANAGAVVTLVGSQFGLTSVNGQLWSQATSGVTGSPDNGDEFGSALSVGDFNGDSFRDLAIGVPHESANGKTDVGAVNVVYGTDVYLSADDSQVFYGTTSHGEFGSALGAGQLDVFTGQDLAIGAPHAIVGGHADVGQVSWLSGSQDGLERLKALRDNSLEEDAHCGASIAIGNVDGQTNGTNDIVSGCPDGDLGTSASGAGYVEVYSALADKGPQDPPALAIKSHSSQDPAAFGTSVAVGDVGNVGGRAKDEVLVGEPGFDVVVPDRGAILKQDAGLALLVSDVDKTISQREISQGVDGIAGDTEGGDILGEAVATGDFNGDGWADLAIGVPGERVGSAPGVPGAGCVSVVYGSKNGMTTVGNKFFSQATSGIIGTVQAEDFFGDALAGRTD